MKALIKNNPSPTSAFISIQLHQQLISMTLSSYKLQKIETQENQPQASRFIILIIYYYLPQFKTKVRLNNSSIEIICTKNSNADLSCLFLISAFNEEPYEILLWPTSHIEAIRELVWPLPIPCKICF